MTGYGPLSFVCSSHKELKQSGKSYWNNNLFTNMSRCFLFWSYGPASRRAHKIICLELWMTCSYSRFVILIGKLEGGGYHLLTFLAFVILIGKLEGGRDHLLTFLALSNPTSGFIFMLPNITENKFLLGGQNMVSILCTGHLLYYITRSSKEECRTDVQSFILNLVFLSICLDTVFLYFCLSSF